MRLIALVVAAVLLVPGTALAVDASAFNMENIGAIGDLCGELKNDSKERGPLSRAASARCVGYVLGVADMAQVSDNSFPPVCFPTEGNPQLGLVVAKWVDEHPEERHRNRVVGVLMAFREAFPCND